MQKLYKNRLNKWLTSLVLGLTLLISGCTTLPTAPTTGDIPLQIVVWSEQNVWKILKQRGHGSGFWINNRQLITACHVVDDILEVAAIGTGGDIVMFKVKTCNKNLDIAILERDFNKYSEFRTHSTPISWVEPSLGARVFGAGYPLWFNLTINDGHYGGAVIIPWNRGLTMYSNSVPTIDGDSGSPLLSIRQGRVYIEGVRLAMAGTEGKFQPVYVPHMAMAASGKQLLGELKKYNLLKQKGVL